MNNRKTLRQSRGGRPAFTMIEMIVAIVMSTIVMMTVALLIQSGYKSWLKTFNNANSDSRIDSLDTMIALGTTGRQSNKMNYSLYTVVGGVYAKPLPVVNPDEVLTGQAIEFHYWDPPDLDASLLDPAIPGNAYSLFYLDGTNLKVDKGIYPPGGVNGGHRVTGGDVTTITLARNVTSLAFTHTGKNMTGDGKGCIRMRMVITDPVSHETKTTLAATMMRNVWP
jgi:prepilin-type N-terminal cleavage/methylation domain-containing protein